MSVWWSVALSAVALLTSWMIGNRWKFAWLLGVAQQVAWFTYAVTTDQWGFAVSAVAFGFMNARNYLRWARDEAVARERVEVTR